MRLRTIKRRMKLAMLSEADIQEIFHKMNGVSDKSTLYGEGQKKWVKVVTSVFKTTKIVTKFMPV